MSLCDVLIIIQAPARDLAEKTGTARISRILRFNRRPKTGEELSLADEQSATEIVFEFEKVRGVLQGPPKGKVSKFEYVAHVRVTHRDDYAKLVELDGWTRHPT
jgi:hypothetical protein